MAQCPVCLESFEEDKIEKFGLIISHCNHKIHSVCYQECIDNKVEHWCPLCREPFKINTIISPKTETEVQEIKVPEIQVKKEKNTFKKIWNRFKRVLH